MGVAWRVDYGEGLFSDFDDVVFVQHFVCGWRGEVVAEVVGNGFSCCAKHMFVCVVYCYRYVVDLLDCGVAACVVWVTVRVNDEGRFEPLPVNVGAYGFCLLGCVESRVYYCRLFSFRTVDYVAVGCESTDFEEFCLQHTRLSHYFVFRGGLAR